MRKIGVYIETFLQELGKAQGRREFTLHLFGTENSFARYSSLRGQRREVPFLDHDYEEVVGFLPSEGKRDLVFREIGRVIEELY